MPQHTARSMSERLIDEFVTDLSQDEGLDQDVIEVVRNLHWRGRLNSRNLLKALEEQREEWAHGETP